MTVTRFQLRELLEEIGMSQSELSRQSGVSFATINRMCTNATRQVSLDTLERLARALNREPTDLIGRFADNTSLPASSSPHPIRSRKRN